MDAVNLNLSPPLPVRLGTTEAVADARSLSDLEHLLIELWEEILGCPVDIAQSFFALNDDQQLATDMLEKLADRSGIKVSATDLLRAPTVEQLAKLLQKPKPSASPQRLVEIQKGSDDSIPFFFVHGDGRNGGVYCQKLVRYLGEQQRFIAIHPHGIQEPFVVPGSIEKMAAENVQDLLALQKEGPYIVGGLCNGAVIAFEMAQQLQKQGKHVKAVVLVLAPPEVRLLPFSPLALANALRGKADSERTFDLRGLSLKERADRFLQIFGRLYLRYRFKRFTGRLLVVEALNDPLIADFVEVHRSFLALLRFYAGRLLRRLGLPRLAQKVLGSKLGQLGGAMRGPSALHALFTVPLGQRMGPMNWRQIGEEVMLKEMVGGHETTIVHAEELAEFIKSYVPLTRVNQSLS